MMLRAQPFRIRFGKGSAGNAAGVKSI